jgi:voltage-gated potassium channel Kch
MKFIVRNLWNSVVYWDFSLLAMVIFLIFFIPFFPPQYHSRFYDIFFSLIYIFAALAIGRKNRFILWFAVTFIILEWLSSELELPLINGISRSLSMIFFIIIVILFIVGIAKAKKVDLNVILDAINGYLLLSIVFGILIAIIMRHNSQAFNFPNLEVVKLKKGFAFTEYMYYSIVTITTLGYGDIVPKTPYAKSLATFISICGQFYIAILLALLVGKFAASQNK